MRSGDAAIELVGVSKAPALVGVDLAVAAGELVALVGPSGAGKSTVLRLIAGLESPSHGVVRVGGRAVTGDAAAAGDVAIVVQGQPLYAHLTVYDNLAFALRVCREAPAQIAAQVERVADALGIAGLLGRTPRHLGGGERQRVAIAAALARAPRVLLFDEPLSNLDLAARVEVRTALRAHQRATGAAMLYVTHDRGEAAVLADRIVALRAGVVVPVAGSDDAADADAGYGRADGLRTQSRTCL